MSVDATGVKKGVASAQTSMDGLKKAALRLGGVLSAGALFRGIIKNSIEAQHSLAQLQAVLKSTGGAAGRSVGDLTAQADALQAVTSFGDDAIVSAQALLLTFTKIQGTNFDRATETVLDLATAMGGDLKGASIQVGKALNDPVAGITALRKVGVSFTDSQRALIKSLMDTGDQAGAQAVILKELQVEFGGSARAARNTLGGALAGLSNAWGNALEVSGTASGGIIGALNSIGDAIPWIRSQIDAFVGGFQIMAAELAVSGGQINVWQARFSAAFDKALGDSGARGAILGFAGFVKGLPKPVQFLLGLMDWADVGPTLARGAQGNTANLVDDAIANLGRLRLAADEVARSIVNPTALPAMIPLLSGMADESGEAADALKKLVDEAAKITEGARIPTQIWADTIANLNTHLEAGRITQQTWYQAVAEATVALGESAKVVEEKLNPAIAEAARITESARTKTEVYRDTLIELAGHLAAGRISQETFNRSMIAAAETLADGAKAARTFGEEAQSMTLRAIDDFAAFAVGAGGSISDFVKGAMRDLAKLAARFLLIAGLKAAFAGSTGGFGGFVLGAIEGRASGGPVRAGQPYMVGERGPEMFVPSSSGSIVPGGGMSASAIMAALGPVPRPMTPREVARDSWYREFIRLAVADNAERG